MPLWLAYGEKADQSGADWVLILVGAFMFAVVAALAAIPVGLAARRAKPSRRELVLAASILWGVITAGSALYSVSAQFKWAHERDLLIQSGYYDPATKKDAPSKPWGWWGVLAAAYPVLLMLGAPPRRSSAALASRNPENVPSEPR